MAWSKVDTAEREGAVMSLFGLKHIRSVSFSQDEILNDIIQLHCPGGIECDATYSTGMFYKKIKKPIYKFDLTPTSKEITAADCRNLPLEDGFLKNIMLDPPFIASWNVESEAYKMSTRFTTIRGIKNLLQFYKESIIESHRVLQKKGILIFKCQDMCYARDNHFVHCLVFSAALEAGFKAKDLFVLVAKSRFNSHKNQKQHHARKYHSYFWVFEKK